MLKCKLFNGSSDTQVFERKSNWNFHSCIHTHTHRDTHIPANTHKHTHTNTFEDSPYGLLLGNLYNLHIADVYHRHYSK